jgi:hypothetical protein
MAADSPADRASGEIRWKLGGSPTGNKLVAGFDRKGRIVFRLHLPAPTFRAVPVPPGATGVARLARGMSAMRG